MNMDTARVAYVAWRQSVITKIFVVSFICIHLPLLTLMVSFVDYNLTVFLVVLGATLAGTIACVGTMWWLIAPLRNLSNVISRYRDTGDFHDENLDKRGNGEIAVVTRAVCGMASEIRDLAERLQDRPQLDPLTGLVNGNFIYDRDDARLFDPERRAESVFVVLFELEGLAQVGITSGREAVDQVLVRIGDAVRGALQKGDVGARMGSAVFMLILPRSDMAEARAVCEALKQAIDALVFEGIDRGLVHARFGISARNAEWPDVPELIHEADMALYRARETRRNGLEFGAR